VGTHEIPQSRAIERFLAKKFKLYGDNDEEAAMIDAFVDQINDIRMHSMLLRHQKRIRNSLMIFQIT